MSVVFAAHSLLASTGRGSVDFGLAPVTGSSRRRPGSMLKAIGKHMRHRHFHRMGSGLRRNDSVVLVVSEQVKENTAPIRGEDGWGRS